MMSTKCPLEKLGKDVTFLKPSFLMKVLVESGLREKLEKQGTTPARVETSMKKLHSTLVFTAKRAKR